MLRTYSGSPVTTISKATLILGFDTIKTSALAMLLVDGMSGKHAQSVRSELAQVLGQASSAELARRSHFKDAEEAAVAALSKNIGRVLVTAHEHERYTRIVQLIVNCCRLAFPITGHHACNGGMSISAGAG